MIQNVHLFQAGVEFILKVLKVANRDHILYCLVYAIISSMFSIDPQFSTNSHFFVRMDGSGLNSRNRL
jgi:hypothetical protein